MPYGLNISQRISYPYAVPACPMGLISHLAKSPFPAFIFATWKRGLQVTPHK